MNWSNVKLILGREIRDQSRDRRTLFMIVVLPLLLYPLLGMSFLQISQFMREQPTTVLVVGAKGLDDVEPPLIDNRWFSSKLFSDEERAKLLELEFYPDEPRDEAGDEAVAALDPRAEAGRAVEAGEYDATLYFPPDFADRLEAVRRALAERMAVGEVAPEAPAEARLPGVPDVPEVPSPEIIYSTATEKSQLTFARLSMLIEQWRSEITKQNLVAGGVPAAAARPFDFQSADVANQTAFQGAAVWSKILPVMLLLWALTGAFYPAIDLCAGEKERGTLETLLSSPAERSEIVLGKLVTIMLFSAATAILNLVAIGITGALLMSQLPGVGQPPLTSILWLLVALVPVSALFSALCLALAAFARSSKEGQYYLMPLLLVVMPLVILPMTGVELNLGNSLIPVTGMVLLLRAALEGNYWQALQFLPPVLGVTIGCCLVAIRWAVDQFTSESVLFRESERLDVGLWLKHLSQDRQPTPTVAAAVFCGVTILLVKFFMSFALVRVTDLAMQAAFTQLVVIATPALLLTVLFTTSPRRTLLLRRPPWLAAPAAVLLALALHPVANVLQGAVMRLYPVSNEMTEALKTLFQGGPNLAVLLVVIAVLPAVCEELAFRGFILSGLRHTGHKWRAIILTSIFFGLTHSILQQSIIACLLGVVIGYLAVQSGSILPCMLFHVCHNGLAVLTTRITPAALERFPVLRMLLAPSGDGETYVYRLPAVVLGGLVALAVLVWFSRLRYEKSAEEELQESIGRDVDPDDDSWAAEPDPPTAGQQEGESVPCPAPECEA